MQEPQFRDDPVANLVHGLILHQLWYDGVTEGLNIRENSVNTPSEDMEIDTSENSSMSYGPAANSPPFPSRESSKKENLTRLDSDSSIGNEKEFPKGSGYNFSRKQCSRGPVYNTHEQHVEGVVYDTHEHHVEGIVYDTREHPVEGAVYDIREHHVQEFNKDIEECSSGDEGDISEAMTVGCSSGEKSIFLYFIPCN